MPERQGYHVDYDDSGTAASVLLTHGAHANLVDVDGHYPFFFVCAQNGDLTTIYQMIRAAGSQGLFGPARRREMSWRGRADSWRVRTESWRARKDSRRTGRPVMTRTNSKQSLEEGCVIF